MTIAINEDFFYKDLTDIILTREEILHHKTSAMISRIYDLGPQALHLGLETSPIKPSAAILTVYKLLLKCEDLFLYIGNNNLWCSLNQHLQPHIGELQLVRDFFKSLTKHVQFDINSPDFFSELNKDFGIKISQFFLNLGTHTTISIQMARELYKDIYSYISEYHESEKKFSNLYIFLETLAEFIVFANHFRKIFAEFAETTEENKDVNVK